MDSAFHRAIGPLAEPRCATADLPEILATADPATAGRIHELRRQGQIDRFIDAVPCAIEDLFKIEFPFLSGDEEEFQKTYDTYIHEHWNEAETTQKTVFVYLPWRRVLVRLPRPDIYTCLRTARNRYLITEAEQRKYYHSTVGIAGMSIGSQVLTALILTGGPSRLHLADYDVLSIPNMNRLPGTIADLAQSKLYAAARRAYEVNPFASLSLFPDGLHDENMERFFSQPDELDIFVEECDDIRMKIVSRFKARAMGIPVIMATDNGDNTIIDVERFDLEPDRPLFHGRVTEERLGQIPAHLSLTDKTRLANDIVGPNVVPRMQMSLQAVGQELPAWPQLGTAAMLSGAALAYVTRRILCGQPMPSGRYEVHLDASLDPDYHTPEAVQARMKATEEFIEGFTLVFSEETDL